MDDTSLQRIHGMGEAVKPGSVQDMRFVSGAWRSFSSTMTHGQAVSSKLLCPACALHLGRGSVFLFSRAASPPRMHTCMAHGPWQSRRKAGWWRIVCGSCAPPPPGCAPAPDISVHRTAPLWPRAAASAGDGFGDPRHKTGSGVISVSNILLQLQVKPCQYVAVVIMEYADKGTLQEAIYKRQIFKESPRWNKRIAARALFRTAREIALGMQHLHSSNILHGVSAERLRGQGGRGVQACLQLQLCATALRTSWHVFRQAGRAPVCEAASPS